MGTDRGGGDAAVGRASSGQTVSARVDGGGGIGGGGGGGGVNKKRQMSRGHWVGDRCDELRRQRQRYRWGKKRGVGGGGGCPFVMQMTTQSALLCGGRWALLPGTFRARH